MKNPTLKSIQKRVITDSVPNRPSLPILNKLFVEENWRQISGNNLDWSYLVSDTGNFAGEASYLIDKKTALANIGTSINNGGDTLRLGSLSIPYNVDPDKYPLMPAFKKQVDTHGFSWPEFREHCRWLTLAASNDKTRPALCGVLFEQGVSDSYLVSTNGHRLYRDRLTSHTCGNLCDMLIPRNLLVAISKLPACDNGYVTLRIPETGEPHGQITIEFDGIVIDYVFRVVDGPFPAYAQVFPKEMENTILFDVAWLRDAVKSSLSVASKVTHQVKFECTNGRLTVSAIDLDTSAKVETATDILRAPDLLAGFNGAYIIDMLSGTDKTHVAMKFDNREGSATLWVLSDHRDALLMPLRLAD